MVTRKLKFLILLVLNVWRRERIVLNITIPHQGESCVNHRQLTSRQEHVPLLSYTKSCDIHQYWFPCAFNSDSSPPDHPATIQWLVKIPQDPPVCTNTHQRGPSASLDVGGG
ncbi:hypothetical protein O181_124113, partial [Austropuccinia psidii MF-1]|nr:hypothetical protein [Austropuccinia psidii MF-1]